jgi:short-subunit dehydrogenase
MGQAASALEVSENHDLGGKVAVITGASSGIGKEAAKVLLVRGAQVVMPVRSLSKGETVKKELQDECASNHSRVLPPDHIQLFQVCHTSHSPGTVASERALAV